MANSQLQKATALEVLPDYQPLGSLTKAAEFLLEVDPKAHNKGAANATMLARLEENEEGDIDVSLGSSESTSTLEQEEEEASVMNSRKVYVGGSKKGYYYYDSA